MKISNTTLGILKNYASINPSLVVSAGSTLRTISPQKNMIASATVPEEFPAFAIYDLNQFLSVMSVSKEPDLDFNDKSVIVTGNGVRVEYFFADQALIQSSGNADEMYAKIKSPVVALTVHITKDQLEKVLRTASVLNSPEVSISGKGSTINLIAQDTRNKHSNRVDVILGENTNGDDFKTIFKRENIKFLPADYDVDIAAKGTVHMTAKLDADTMIEYYAAAESSSSFVSGIDSSSKE